MVRFFSWCLLAVFLLASAPLHAEIYSTPGHINTGQFAALYDHAIVVDTRSRLEYDVLHIKNAVHIPSGTMVAEDLERLLKQYPHKPIVFYCNGTD
jgi:predicted sulfurtransferase